MTLASPATGSDDMCPAFALCKQDHMVHTYKDVCIEGRFVLGFKARSFSNFPKWEEEKKGRVKILERWKAAPSCSHKMIPQSDIMQPWPCCSFQVTEDAVQGKSPLTYYYSDGAKTDDAAIPTEETAAVAAE